jgi:predicted phage terminase large subunit-like protein
MLQVIDDLPEDGDWVSVRAWDLAGTEGAGAFTVGVKIMFNRKNEKFYITDVRRKQLSAGGVRDMIEETATEDGIGVRILLPQDPGQAGKGQVDDLIAMLRGYDARAEIQSGKKEVRAEPFAAQVERGHVYVLKRHWTKPFIEELRFFPRGRFKDQVDAVASGFNELAPLTRKKQRALHLRVVSERQENYAIGA